MKTKKVQKSILYLMVLLLVCSNTLGTYSEGSENPFLHASRLGMSLPSNLITQWKTLQTARISLENEQVKSQARKEVAGLLSGASNEAQKCKICRDRVERKWHEKVLAVKN